MSGFLKQAIDAAMKEIEQRIQEALDEMPVPPIVIDSTAIVLDATPVLLPMHGEKKVEGKEC